MFLAKRVWFISVNLWQWINRSTRHGCGSTITSMAEPHGLGLWNQRSLLTETYGNSGWYLEMFFAKQNPSGFLGSWQFIYFHTAQHPRVRWGSYLINPDLGCGGAPHGLDDEGGVIRGVGTTCPPPPLWLLTAAVVKDGPPSTTGQWFRNRSYKC